MNVRNPESTFLGAVDSLAASPFFGVPANARDVVVRHGSTTKVVLLGTKEFGDHLLALQERGCEVIGAVDDFRYTQKALHRGIPIISTDRFLDLAKGGDVVALNTCRYDYSKRFFDNLCREHVIPCLNYEQAVRAFRLQGKVDYRVDDWGPTIVANAGRYRDLARRLDDPYSVETLFGVLNFHLTCDPEHSHQVERPYSTLYFRSGLLDFTAKERMVDCGASIGESLAGLIGTTGGTFEHSWLIEPDRLNIEKLKDILRRLEGTPLASKVSLHGVALGQEDGRVAFNHVGGHGGSILPAGDERAPSDFVEVRAVDDIINDAPTFIKMDIEGAELGALQGCRRSIENAKPKLAISAYHRAGDLFELTDYVLSLNPDYKVGLRHHTEERWDTCLYFY